ncbi:hypothetical protein D9615_008912 [Tricholomella constricta]|uniref:DNA 3'-5' helicase n=1 Tax=Tricholomella constricta TaxID=117010 RepID=A0A8H5H1C5_9AGAR|nr:hypothetical protein D9615_008912 [Tricholomella constricta]
MNVNEGPTASSTHLSPARPPSTPSRNPLSSIPDPANSPFDTPRRRKTPSSTLRAPQSCKWPRIGKVIPVEDIVNASQELYGFTPREWQIKIFTKAAEGFDTFGIAGTGSGKSLVFVLLALAAEMADCNGLVIVISPLKSLQKDQVLRFNDGTGRAHYKGRELKISAVAVNEDNHDDAVFTQLGQGSFRLCYASPECLLRNTRFKKLFRREHFRKRIIAMVVDESHVIEAWKDEFRKDYNELYTLRVIAGSEIPWMALTATCSTQTFEIIYTTLGMGGARPFWGIDLGSDRPNLAQWVRPLEYSVASMADLFAFVPHAPQSPEQFEKTIFYFRTRQLTRHALKICRSLVSVQFRSVMYAFTATASEEFKDKVTDLFRTNEARFIFATLALGMGLDIPDIFRVVIYGVDTFNDAFQKGGRGGRARDLKATMIWLVEPWAFNRSKVLEEGNKLSKREHAEEEKRRTMDPASREYINRSQSNLCMRAFACNHFRPRPNLQGFPWYQAEGSDSEDEVEGAEVTWVVEEQQIAMGGACGCSSKCCRVDPEKSIGLLTDTERALVLHHMAMLAAPTGAHPTNTPDNQICSTEPLSDLISTCSSAPLRCSKPEREVLRQALVSWRDARWASIRSNNPFLSREWVLSDGNISRLVDKAHILLNSHTVDARLVNDIIKWMADDLKMHSLVSTLQNFCAARREREIREAAERKSKRPNSRSVSSTAHDTDLFAQSSSENAISSFTWQIQNYIH